MRFNLPGTWLGIGLILALVLSAPISAEACTCAKLQAKYNKLQNKYKAAVDAGRTSIAAATKRRIKKHVMCWKEIPGCPPPTLPPGWCPDPTGGGGIDDIIFSFPGGRGHAGAVTGITGDTVSVPLFLRNADPSSGKTVTVRIEADSLNPPGFIHLDTFKTIVLPALGSGPDPITPIEVEILSLDLVSSASFHVTVEETDGSFWNEHIDFTVHVSDVRITPIVPVVEVPVSGSFSLGWTIENPNPFPVTKSYSFLMIPDNEGLATFNSEATFPIFNSYPADKTVTGGTVTIAAGGSEDILKDHISNELCEPTMLGCCGLEVDGDLCIVATPNDATTPFDPPITSEGLDLMGTPFGGVLEVQMILPPDVFVAAVPTFPGQPLEEITDQLVQEIHQQYLNTPGFPFQAVPIDNFVDVFGPPGGVIQFGSFDPGLNWQPAGCEAPGWEHAELLGGDQVLLSWIPNNPPPVEYDIQIQSAGGPLFFTIPGTQTQFITPPLAQGLMSWEIVAVCDPGLPDFSQPSFPDSLEIPPCNDGQPPVGLSQTFLPSGNVELHWGAVPNTTACQVQGSRISPPGVSGNRNILGPEPASTVIPASILGVGPSTWEWSVRCACNISPLNATPLSAPSTFSIGTSPRLSVLKDELKVYPNPASLELTVEITADVDSELQIRLTDLTGRTLLLRAEFVQPGQNNISVNTAEIPTGLYLIQVGDNTPGLLQIVH